MADKVAARDTLMFRLGLVSGRLCCTVDRLKELGVRNGVLDDATMVTLESIQSQLLHELEHFGLLVHDARKAVPYPTEQKAE